MTNKLIAFEKLITEKCSSEKEWSNILEILKETELYIWLTGKEQYQNFHVIKEPDTKKIIGCFTFTQEGSIGILKNLAIAKTFQRKGISTFIVNNKIPKIAKELGIKKLYLHGNDRGPFTSHHFWEKTIFKHIKSTDVKDKYYIDYFNHLVNNYSPDVLNKESIFYLDID